MTCVNREHERIWGVMEIFTFYIMIVMVVSYMTKAFVKIHGTVHQKV